MPAAAKAISISCIIAGSMVRTVGRDHSWNVGGSGRVGAAVLLCCRYHWGLTQGQRRVGGVSAVGLLFCHFRWV